MNGQKLQRSHSAKYRAPPPPSSIDINDSEMSSSLPETFISSLHQLFSILDKTNCGYVPFDVFKRYFDSSSSSTLDLLNELENESKTNNYLITFHSFINAIQRSLSLTKRPPSILIPKVTRSSNAFVDTKKIERQIPVVYQSSNGLETNRNNEIDFSMIRALKRYAIERNLLIQTCQTIDQVKFYLNDCLLEMKDKQKIYCRHLSTAETTGMAIESMYNRDLVADLLKLATIVIEDGNYDLKKSSSSSSSSSFNLINNQYRKQLKAKDDHIKHLETEKRVLLKELIEMRHQQGTVIPIKLS